MRVATGKSKYSGCRRPDTGIDKTGKEVLHKMDHINWSIKVWPKCGGLLDILLLCLSKKISILTRLPVIAIGTEKGSP